MEISIDDIKKFDTLETKLYDRCKEIADFFHDEQLISYSPCDFADFEIMDDKISIRFEEYCCGDYENYYLYLSLEMFCMPLIKMASEYRENLNRETIKRMKEKQEKEKQEKIKELENQKTLYLELKKKFEKEK